MEMLAPAVSSTAPTRCLDLLSRGFCPYLMHLVLDLFVVSVSIMQLALFSPDMVNVKYLPFVYLVRGKKRAFGKAKSLEKQD